MPIAIPHPVAACICFVFAMSAAAYANLRVMAMVDQINRKSAHEAQESIIGHAPAKVIRLFEQYRRLCPEGRLHINAVLGTVLTLLGMVGVAVSVGIIG